MPLGTEKSRSALSCLNSSGLQNDIEAGIPEGRYGFPANLRYLSVEMPQDNGQCQLTQARTAREA